MRLLRFLAILALPVLMAACSSIPGTTYDLDRLKTITPVGPAFTQDLSHEYQAFAESERDQYDWIPMWHFARKGTQAAEGVAVQPENLAEWTFEDPKAAADIADARLRLVALLNPPMEQQFPALVATAQVKWDCWVLHQHEGWQTDSTVACRNDFNAAMSAIATQVAAAAAPPPPPPEAAPPPDVTPAAPPPAPPVFRVFFDNNKAALTAEAKQVVAAALAAAKANPNARITVTGYTDASGSAKYNQLLSEKRALAVAKALAVAGIPSSQIVVAVEGASNPMVSAPQGKKTDKNEAQNRRVEIQFSP